MAITYFERERVFRLDTPHTTYLLGLVDQEGFLGQIYYGPRLPEGETLRALLRLEERPVPPSADPDYRPVDVEA